MGEQLYGLTARTADHVRQILADGGETGGRTKSGAEARGVTWVKVTALASSGEWHTGVVSLTSGPGWEDGTVEVLVASAGGGKLDVGRRYPCTRTGDAADGTARFRADEPPCQPFGFYHINQLGGHGSPGGQVWGEESGGAGYRTIIVRPQAVLSTVLPSDGLYLFTFHFDGAAYLDRAELLDHITPTGGAIDPDRLNWYSDSWYLTVSVELFPVAHAKMAGTFREMLLAADPADPRIQSPIGGAQLPGMVSAAGSVTAVAQVNGLRRVECHVHFPTPGDPAVYSTLGKGRMTWVRLGPCGVRTELPVPAVPPPPPPSPPPPPPPPPESPPPPPPESPPPPPPPPDVPCCTIADGTPCQLVVTGGVYAGTYNVNWSSAFTPAGAYFGSVGTVTCNPATGKLQLIMGACGPQDHDGAPACGPPVTATWTDAAFLACVHFATTSVVFTTL